jgi:alkane 1-monooxygenase
MDSSNPPDSILKWLEQDRYYRWCTYVFIPIQYAGLVLACWLWSNGDLSVAESIGLALTMAVVGGIAINTAHELGHKRENSERWLSRVALAQTGYGHFFIEHNRGHHVRVATPEDPASSRLGESFWAFLPRTVSGSVTSAWEIEAKRLDRLGKSHWSLSNDLVSAWLMTVVLFAALTIVFGPVVLPYLLIQAVLGFSLLEVVNYLEHYGLLRQKKEDGRYQRCLPEHSWNSNNVASNVLLYHLQRHSDHHANPTRRYQALRHVEEAPQLPTGYAGMIVLAWFPPIWRRVMDPRLLDHFEGDVTRANIQPSKREKILARYGATSGAAA